MNKKDTPFRSQLPDPDLLDLPDDKADWVLLIFKNNLIEAANTVVGVMKGVIEERLRFNAAVYVIERIMGAIPKGEPDSTNDKWEQLRKEIRNWDRKADASD